MKKTSPFVLLFSAVVSSHGQQLKSPVDYVDPFIGSQGTRWFAFTPACLPFPKTRHKKLTQVQFVLPDSDQDDSMPRHIGIYTNARAALEHHHRTVPAMSGSLRFPPKFSKKIASDCGFPFTTCYRLFASNWQPQVSLLDNCYSTYFGSHQYGPTGTSGLDLILISQHSIENQYRIFTAEAISGSQVKIFSNLSIHTNLLAI
jgi:hypothetical protein